MLCEDVLKEGTLPPPAEPNVQSTGGRADLDVSNSSEGKEEEENSTAVSLTVVLPPEV